MMNRSQGEALVALIHQLRKDWDPPGIRAAIQKAQHLGPACDIAAAACRLAANPDARTPALLPEPGTHWQGTSTGQRPAPLMCPDHPQHRLTRCPDCQALLTDTDHTAGAQRVRDALTKARTDS